MKAIHVSVRILTVQFKTCHNYLTVVGVYATEEGWEEETDKFCETFIKKFIKWNRTDYLIVSGDFNVSVGNKAVSGLSLIHIW